MWNLQRVGYIPLMPVVFTALIHLGVTLTVPNLSQVVPRLDGIQLKFSVAVGKKESPFQFRNLQVELKCSEQTVSLRKRGPQQGTRRYALSLLKSKNDQKPYYINDNGIQYVKLERAQWQMSWSRNSPHGFLLINFDVPESLQRNADLGQEGATLSKGGYCLVYRIWTAKTLQSERERRKSIQSKAAGYLSERDSKIQKLQETNNIWQKVTSYGQAAQSMNNFLMSGLQEARFIPLYDDQVLELASPDCICSTRGVVYKIEGKRDLVEVGQSRVDIF